MTARKSLPRFSFAQQNRLSIQSHQSEISAVLDPDSYVDSNDEANPLWFKDFENHSIRPSARFSLAQSDTPILKGDFDPDSTPLDKSWWKHVDNTLDFSRPTTDVSRDRDRSKVGDASNTGSSDISLVNEVVIKKKPAPRFKKRKSLQNNVFSEILETSVRSEKIDKVSGNEEKQQNQSDSETSDTSRLDVVTKKKSAVLVKKRKRSQKNVFSELLESSRDSTRSEKNVQESRNEAEPRDRRRLEASEISTPDELFAKRRSALRNKEEKILQSDLVSDLRESTNEKDIRNVRRDDERQNSSYSESADEIVAKKRPAPRKKNRKSIQQNVFSDILESAKNSSSSEQNVPVSQDDGKQQNKSNLESSDISLDEIVAKKRPAPRTKKRRSLHQNVFSELLESSKESNISEQNIRAEQDGKKQRTLTSSSMSDISLEKPKRPAFRKKTKTKLPRKFRDVDSKSDEESAADVFEDALDTLKTTSGTREENKPGVATEYQVTSTLASLNSAATVHPRLENQEDSHDDSEDRMHLAVDMEGSRSPIIMARSMKKSMFKKTSMRASPNFDELLDHESMDEEADNQQSTEAPVQLRGDLSTARLGEDSFDEDDSNTENSIKKQRVPFAQRKRNNQQRQTFSKLLESPNTSIRSEKSTRSEQTGEFPPPRSSGRKSLFAENPHVPDAGGENNESVRQRRPRLSRSTGKPDAERQSTNKRDDHFKYSANIEAEPKFGDQRQSIYEQNDDWEISGVLNDESNHPSIDSKKARNSIANKKSLNQSQVNKREQSSPEKHTPHNQKESETEDLSESNAGEQHSGKKIGPVVVRIERIEASENLLKLPKSSNKTVAKKITADEKVDRSLTPRSVIMGVEENQSGDEEESLRKNNDDPHTSGTSKDKSERKKSEVVATRRTRTLRGSQISTEKKMLNESQISKDRVKTRETDGSLRVDEKPASKYFSPSSDDQDAGNASGSPERRFSNERNDHAETFGSKNVEVEENPSVVSKSNVGRRSTSKKNDDLDTPRSRNDGPEETQLRKIPPRGLSASKRLLDSIPNELQISEKRINTKNKSPGVGNELTDKEASESSHEEEEQEEGDKEGVPDREEHSQNSSRIITKIQNQENSTDRRSKSRDKIGTSRIEQTIPSNEFDKNVAAKKAVSSSKRRSTMVRNRETISEPLKENNRVTAKNIAVNIEFEESINGTRGGIFSSTARRDIETSQQPGVSFDTQKLTQIKSALDKVKNKEIAILKDSKIDSYFKQVSVKKANIDDIDSLKLLSKTQSMKNKRKTTTKIPNKAYLVNGQVYHRPKLPRPKHWATDKLYNFLWKQLEPKYKLRTRIRSEKFILELGEVVSIILRRKKYENYKEELNNLICEMARLGIIKTRHEFHIFCQNFLPHAFRIKVIPMILPGNVRNIPFEPDKLHLPITNT